MTEREKTLREVAALQEELQPLGPNAARVLLGEADADEGRYRPLSDLMLNSGFGPGNEVPRV